MEIKNERNVFPLVFGARSASSFLMALVLVVVAVFGGQGATAGAQTSTGIAPRTLEVDYNPQADIAGVTIDFTTGQDISIGKITVSRTDGGQFATTSVHSKFTVNGQTFNPAPFSPSSNKSTLISNFSEPMMVKAQDTLTLFWQVGRGTQPSTQGMQIAIEGEARGAGSEVVSLENTSGDDGSSASTSVEATRDEAGPEVSGVEAEGGDIPFTAHLDAEPLVAAPEFRTVPGFGGLELKVEVSNPTPQINEPVTYTYTLKNSGPYDLWWGGPYTKVHNDASKVLKDSVCPRPEYVANTFVSSPNMVGIKSGKTAQISCTVSFDSPGLKANTVTIAFGELWSGNRKLKNLSVVNLEETKLVDVQLLCKDPAAEVVSRQPKRELAEAEFADGSPVYIVTGYPSSVARDTSILSRQTDLGASYIEIGRSPWLYNALMFNSTDNWLYAVSQKRGRDGDPCYPAGNLLQIDPMDGSVRNLGPIRGGDGKSVFETDGDRDFLNTGVWTSRGYFVANTSTSGTRKLYKVDIDLVAATRVFGNVLSYSEDWAVLPEAPRYMWGFQSKAKVRDRQVIERIDTETGIVTTWDLTNLATLDGRKIRSTAYSWGKAWTYSNGNLGFGTGSTGAGQNGFELGISNPDSNSPEFNLINIMNNLPASFNTDAASSWIAPPEEYRGNLLIQKLRSRTEQIGAEVRTYWTVIVENNSEEPSSGATFYEYLPTETHFGVNASGPTAKFEGFGAGSSIVNGKAPGPDQFGSGSGILAGVNANVVSGAEGRYMTGYVGKMDPGSRVEFVISAPVRTDSEGNLKVFCSPNKVKLIAVDAEAGAGEADNVSVEACLDKVSVDSAPKPVDGVPGEFTAAYNVVVAYPDVPGYSTNEVVYGRLVDTPRFVNAAEVLGATVAFRDEFNIERETKEFEGAGPYELNSNLSPKITKPKGVDGSNGQHVYTVTVRFRLHAERLNDTSVPSGAPHTPSGNFRCYSHNGSAVPDFGLANEAEMGGWKDSDCIPLTPPDKKMSVLLEKVSFDPAAPGQMRVDGLLEGAQFKVYRGDSNGRLDFNLDGTVNEAVNPSVQQSTTTSSGRIELKELEAPGTYFLIESKAPAGFSLLAEPVKFSTAWASDGSAVVSVLSGGALAVSGNQCERLGVRECAEKNVGVLQIVDVTKGELPKTGGRGVGLWLLLGVSIVVLGVVSIRRRTLAS